MTQQTSSETMENVVMRLLNAHLEKSKLMPNYHAFARYLLSDPAILDHIPAVKALREEIERLSRERDMFEQSVAHWKKAYREDTETLRDSKECALAQLHEVTQATKNLCFMAQTTGGGPDAKLIEAINTVANKLELASVAEAHRQFEGQRERIAELEANAMKHAANVIGFFQKIEALESQLAELRQGGEAVGEVVLESMGVPGSDAQIVRFHMYKEIPPVGTKLYTRPQPAIPPGYAVVHTLSGINGVGRLGDCEKCAAVWFDHIPTDDELRQLQAMLAAAPSVPVAEKALPENVKLLLLKAHRQLETEYRQQTRATEAKHVANGTCGESPGGASSIALLAESGYISSIGKRNQEVRDEIFAMLAAPADSKEGE